MTAEANLYFDRTPVHDFAPILHGMPTTLEFCIPTKPTSVPDTPDVQP
jgi:hypothetical protein